jgi:starch synthase
VRKILFASSEVHPLIKTGGLADVSASLPRTLKQQGQDVKIVMPAYRECLSSLENLHIIAELDVVGFHKKVHILEAMLPDSDVIIWLVHSPHHFDRDGGPYGNKEGDWHDNAARFALFSRVIALLATNQTRLDWQPDILHCNDWQTGLAPAFIAHLPYRPKIVFTIHNLAYQGLYSRDVFDALDLPEMLWSTDGIEFFGQMSFMKGGLVYADHVNTVSPTYAKEICTPEYGFGLEGLLQHLTEQGVVSGILNGIDMTDWDPSSDQNIAQNYTAKTVKNKLHNKTMLQQHFHLPMKDKVLMIGFISRLVAQKGVDLSLAALTQLLQAGESIQVICLGSGEEQLEHGLRVLRAHYPDKVAIHLGYDEALAHQIEAGIDLFLMPSRFEPCGLNQLYSLRYGTLPLVRATGGLADSVVDASQQNRNNNTATGFTFEDASVEALQETLYRAIELYQHPRLWRKVMLTAMMQDFSWQNSALTYQALYDQLLKPE